VTSTPWVDQADHPVRQALPGIGTSALTGSYRYRGRPVDIEPPPATQVR
jgi:hypothetical protein